LILKDKSDLSFVMPHYNATNNKSLDKFLKVSYYEIQPYNKL